MLYMHVRCYTLIIDFLSELLYSSYVIMVYLCMEVFFMKSTFYVEYYGKQIDEATLIKEAKSIWTKSGKKACDLKSLELYIKPEENMAYYVFNHDDSGSFPIE